MDLVQIADEHLDADKAEHGRKPILQVMEHRGKASQRKIKRTQSQNSEDIGCIDDEGVPTDGENRGDGIHSEDDISHLHKNQRDEEGRREAFAVFTDKKSIAVQNGSDGQDPSKHFDDDIFVEIDFLFFGKRHLNAREHEKAAKHIDGPVEFFNQGDASKDENRAHDQGAQNAPEQNLVLILRRNFKESENEKKNEDIVDAE